MSKPTVFTLSRRAEILAYPRGGNDNNVEDIIITLKSGSAKTNLNLKEWADFYKQSQEINESVQKTHSSSDSVASNDDASLETVYHIKSIILELFLSDATKAVLMRQFNDLLEVALDAKFRAFRIGEHKRIRLLQNGHKTQIVIFAYNENRVPITLVGLDFHEWLEFYKNVAEINELKEDDALSDVEIN